MDLLDVFLLVLQCFSWVFWISFALWLYYVLVVGGLMPAYKAGRIPASIVRICLVIAFIGKVFDGLYNLTLGTIIFLDAPRELMLTTRLIRYKRQGSGWRYHVAVYVCENCLDPFELDWCHCKD